MGVFKDVLRLVGVALLLFGAWKANVAAAIAGGALYAGGFGERLTFWELLQRRPKADGENVVMLRPKKTG